MLLAGLRRGGGRRRLRSAPAPEERRSHRGSDHQIVAAVETRARSPERRARPTVMDATGYELERESPSARTTPIAGVDEVGRGAWAGPGLRSCARRSFTSASPVCPGGLTYFKAADGEAPDRAGRGAARLGCGFRLRLGQPRAAADRRAGHDRALRLAARAALGQLPNGPARSCSTARRHAPHTTPAALALAGPHRRQGRPAPRPRFLPVAASVLAKVHRDTLMAELGESCPDFAFADNAGYPAPA